MRAAIRETDRRRAIQVAYNEEHGITPETVQKGISDMTEFLAMESRAPARRRRARVPEGVKTPDDLERLIVELEEEMVAAAEDLHFEEAGRIRDEIKELRRDLEGMRAGA
jgi:excinuclease ABC subunit B